MKSRSRQFVSTLCCSLIVLLVSVIAPAKADSSGELLQMPASEESSRLTIVFGSPPEFEQHQEVELPADIVDTEGEKILSTSVPETPQSYPLVMEAEMLTGKISDPIVTSAPASAPLVSSLEGGQNSAVPEPSTVILLGMGMLGIAAFLRKKNTR